MSEPIEPGKDRRELIDKGHIEPDPAKDKLSHAEWKAQYTFMNRVKQSVRRTYDDFTGRTEDLEKKAERHGGPPKAPAPEKPTRNSGKSQQQEKWRAERSRNRNAGRDDPEQGRD